MLVVLAAQPLRASGFVNLFSLELVRTWTPVTLGLAEEHCLPYGETETLRKMGAWLEKSRDQSANSALRQGNFACLQGDTQRAQAAWGRANDYDSDHPVALLFLAITLFEQGRVAETPFASEIGRYGYLGGVQARQANDISLAIERYAFSLLYLPSINTAVNLAGTYRLQGDLVQAQHLWLELTQTVSADIPLYWWAKGQLAETEKDWAAAGVFYHQGASLAEAEEAYRSFLRAGMMWYRSEEYERAKDALQQALSLGLKYKRVDFDEELPYLWLGTVAHAQMHYEEALDYFTKFLLLNPTSSGALYEKAVTLESLGRRVEAIEVLAEAIANHQNPPEHWKSLLENWQAPHW